MNEVKKTAPVVKTFHEYLPEPYVDVVSESLTYKGYAPIGTGEAELGWRLLKISVTGTVTKTEYAEGSMDFSHAWSERANYSYSR